MEYLRKFDNHTQYEEARQNLIFPNVSLCVAENEVHYNPWTYAEAYLTFVAKEDGTFKLSTNAVSYSLDNGETWTPLAADTASPTVTAGNKIMWKGELTPSSSYGVGSFSATGDFDVQGNVMSLLYGDNFKGQTDLTGKNYAFYRLFNNNTKVVSVENLSLPATTLANHCYSGMFQGCTNLVNAPELPATTLADECYSDMFEGCTNLTTAPDLPATTLVTRCYSRMFQDCTKLNYIKAMFTTRPSGSSPNYYTQNWVSGVASSGTFVKNAAATWNVTGVNGVPSGWTVETASA